MLSKTAPLFISDCHPSAPLGALPKALLGVWCTACGSLLSDPGLYIGPLGAQCAQSFHSTSERFPQYKTLLFSSSPVTTKTTVWFLDGTEYAGGWLTLSKRLGERSCKPGLGTLHVKSCDAEKFLHSWSCVLWMNCPAVGKDLWKMVKKWKSLHISCWLMEDLCCRLIWAVFLRLWHKQSTINLKCCFKSRWGIVGCVRCVLHLSSALVLVSVCAEEMPSPYLEHTSSESLCDTIDWPEFSYPHFGDTSTNINLSTKNTNVEVNLRQRLRFWLEWSLIILI